MNAGYKNRLAGKILLLFIVLTLVPTLFFGARLIHIATSHMDKDVKAWDTLQPLYVEQARRFHDDMKERLQNEVVLFALYGGFIAVTIALISAGVVLRPLRDLTEGAQRLGSGRLDYRLAVRGNDETARLATAFNSMADSLEARNKELLHKELYIEKMLDPMWVLDRDNRVFDINPAFTKQFGYERGELIGRPAHEFFDDANRPIFDTQMKEKRDRGISDVYEISIRCRRGRNIPVLISCSPIMGSGLAAGKVGVFKDISSRKELEEDLFRKNKELFALNTIAAITSSSMNLDEILRNTVLEVLSLMGMDAGGIYISDDDAQNLTCVSHTGVPGQFLKKMGSFRFGEDIPGSVVMTGKPVAVTDVSKDPRILHHAITETGMKGYLCLPLKSRDTVKGVLCMMSEKEHPFSADELEFLESVSHIVGVAIENIRLYERERSRLSSLVSLEKSRAEAILSSIADGVYTTDRQLRITYWNRAAEAVTGYRSADVVGKPCAEVLRHENESGERLCGKQCLMGPSALPPAEGKTAFCSLAGGGKLPISLTSAPIRDAKGNELGRVNVFRDVTRENEIDRMKTDFVRTVSHELRTPLSAIVGMAEMLLDGEVQEPKSWQSYIETIHTEGNRLASMVEELLDIAKIESGGQEFKRENISVMPVIDNCIRILAGQASAKGITIRRESTDSLPMVRGDRGKFHQVVFNLLNNALSYSNDGSIVRIHAGTQNGRLMLTVEDTGWGIPEQDVPHIFKKFYRSRTHAQRVKGTGLGLPLVLEIVKAHGGTIDVKSAPGKGSTFTVQMPLAENA